MNNNFLFGICFLICSTLPAQWKAQGNKIKTKWADEIDVDNVLGEYPRPIMERSDWKNLNGLWDFTIQEKDVGRPLIFDKKILVPFSIESSLSGVMKEVGTKNEVWYNTTFSVPKSWNGKDILLHFGAVDWKSEIWINDIKVGSHTGGFTPFSFNITPFLNQGNQEIMVKVWDPTNDGYQPRGKQVKNPEGIFYTPVTGIWQTVWIEPVFKTNILTIRTTPDIDAASVKFETILNNSNYGDIVEVTVFDGEQQIVKEQAVASEKINIRLKSPKLWSPESPFLYDAIIKVLRKGKVIDVVKSYFAMRKISTARDDKGIVRMQLNNKDYFHFGPLDQGWWPDGLYTAPTDEALKYDVLKTKEFGYNMIRKHVKVEPARWYTHCDRLGLLVWQDMPSGGNSPQWQMNNFFNGVEIQRPADSEANFKREWKDVIDYLYSYPSIVVWVPFNEAWGQFKTKEISDWTKNYDPSRLVNSASGGNHYPVGDILDVHHYPNPKMRLYDGQRVNVLGEYGGIGLALEGHLWNSENNWGYVKFKNSEEVTNEYIKYAKELITLIKAGFSGAVYTQTTDVEGEVNGLMTYDRKVDKVSIEAFEKINKEVINTLEE